MASETWMWLAAGLGYGAVNSGELLEAYPGGAEAIYDDLGSSTLDEILTQKQAERLATTRPADFALSLAHAETKGVLAVPYGSAQYPEMLRSISNPPAILFVKGDVSLLNGQLSVGMVGARRPSAYGVESVKAIGRGLALGGAIIVSGLAAGLDAEAHKAALAVNGPTIACIAFGHDHCYPAANRTLMEVIERYGAVISEYPPETRPEKPFFLHRNRLIAGLSHALVVAEARRHSGTMSTANFASDYSRDVFAVPGSIFSELSGGTNAMIRDGAYLAGSASDILSLYGIELSEEDPVVAATRQAAEGRPAAASSTPPWKEQPQKSAASRPAAPQERRPQADASEMTLLEALQGELKQDGSKRVSRGEAVDAFRKLQRDLPQGDAKAEAARSRALEEMASAVSDSVEIEARPKERNEARRDRLYGTAPSKKERVKPFQWDTVEHLSREDAQRASARREEQSAVIRSRRAVAREQQAVSAQQAALQEAQQRAAQQAASPRPYRPQEAQPAAAQAAVTPPAATQPSAVETATFPRVQPAAEATAPPVPVAADPREQARRIAPLPPAYTPPAALTAQGDAAKKESPRPYRKPASTASAAEAAKADAAKADGLRAYRKSASTASAAPAAKADATKADAAKKESPRPYRKPASAASAALAAKADAAKAEVAKKESPRPYRKPASTASAALAAKADAVKADTAKKESPRPYRKPASAASAALAAKAEATKADAAKTDSPRPYRKPASTASAAPAARADAAKTESPRPYRAPASTTSAAPAAQADAARADSPRPYKKPGPKPRKEAAEADGSTPPTLADMIGSAISSQGRKSVSALSGKLRTMDNSGGSAPRERSQPAARGDGLVVESSAPKAPDETVFDAARAEVRQSEPVLAPSRMQPTVAERREATTDSVVTRPAVLSVEDVPHLQDTLLVERPVSIPTPVAEVPAPEPVMPEPEPEPAPEPAVEPAPLIVELAALLTETPPPEEEAPPPAMPAPPVETPPEDAELLDEDALLDDDEPEETIDTLSEAAQRAYSQLGAIPVTLGEICEKSGLASGEAMAALTELELAGLSRQLAGRQFVIMQ